MKRASGHSTILDVAERAGVSGAAVSRVLSGKEGVISVSKATRKRIHDAARDLDYVLDARGRILRGKTSPIVGLLADELDSVMRASFMNYLSSALLKRKKEMLFGVHLGNVETARRHIAVFSSYRTAGVITLQGSASFPEALLDILEGAQEKCGPHVAVSLMNPRSDIRTVTFDYAGIFDQLLGAFVDDGRHLAALVGKDNKWDNSLARIFGERVACFSQLKSDVILLPEHETPRRRADQMAARLLDDCRDGPVGAILCHELMFPLLTKNLRRAGKSIPEDAAFVGMWNRPVGEFLDPALSAFDTVGAVELMVEKALALLDDASPDGGDRDRQYKFVPEMIVRDSFIPKEGCVMKRKAAGRSL